MPSNHVHPVSDTESHVNGVQNKFKSEPESYAKTDIADHELERVDVEVVDKADVVKTKHKHVIQRRSKPASPSQIAAADEEPVLNANVAVVRSQFQANDDDDRLAKFAGLSYAAQDKKMGTVKRCSSGRVFASKDSKGTVSRRAQQTTRVVRKQGHE